jgi:hypothetical protein
VDFLEILLELGLGVVDEALYKQKIGNYDAQLVYRLALLGGGIAGEFIVPGSVKPIIKPIQAAGAVLTGKTLGSYIAKKIEESKKAQGYTSVFTAPSTITVTVPQPAPRVAGGLSSY